MAAEGGFEFDREENLPGGSFSKLLLSDDVVEEDERRSKDRASPFGCYYPPVFPHAVSSSTCSSLFSLDTPKMLCFGDYCVEDENGGSLVTSQTVSSSPVSKSSSNASITSLPKTSNSNKRRNGSVAKEDCGAGDKIGPKKSRPVAGAKGSRSSAGHAKAKKREKLGERVAALQQLVSPYGKTDTASVLHETTGYIKFLQDQVKVLCSPYLQRRPPPPSRNGEKEDYKYAKGLKCKGLCLVPVNGITNMETARNGADFWSPVTMNNNTSATAITNSSMSKK